jgi:hypothetical protein
VHSGLSFHLAEQEEDQITTEVEDVLHQEEEEKIHNLKAEDQHQAHMLILHQQEEGGAAILIVIIKLKDMINLTFNAIIAKNLGIMHQNVGKSNMT